jgi:amidase
MTNGPSELWRWDAAALANAIRSRKISSREATRAVLDRIAEVNPKINALAIVLEEEALVAAVAADAATKAGVDLGPLHGVPVTTKLNADQRGQSNSSGVVAFANRIASDDNVAIANLRKAGAVIVGRANTPPFCLRWMTENDLYGRTLNPWSKEHTPGGSTGGGSAALAAGMGALSQGSDNGGSIRYPAFCTGVTGLRPTPGRLAYFNPTQAERPLSMQLIAVGGPLARRVGDLRLGLAAMSAPDARDPFFVPAPLVGPPLEQPIRVALCRDPNRDGVAPSVAIALERAAKALEAAGYVIEEPELPDIEEAAEVWDQICQAELREFIAPLVAELADAPMKQALVYMMARLPQFTLKGYLELYSRRATIIRRWTTLLERWPVLLAPVSTRAQFLQGEDILDQRANDDSYRVQSPLTAFALVPIPGVAVPTGVVDGLPTGVLAMAQRFREDVALDAAAVIEAAWPMATPIDPLF